MSVGVTLTRTVDVTGSEIVIASHVNILNILDEIKDFFTQLFHYYKTFFSGKVNFYSVPFLRYCECRMYVFV